MGAQISTADLLAVTPGDLRIHDVVETGRELGKDAYGSVMEVRYKGTLCACKRVHDVLSSAKLRGGEINHVVEKFKTECERMTRLRHPNIVQYLGFYFNRSGSELPSLVMELLPFTLAGFLKETQSIPSYTKLSILLDVSRGLLYLHTQSPPIMHRDLSVYNVLLTQGLRAKLDLGVARDFTNDILFDTALLSLVPGNPVCMPPEAFQENPAYDLSLDVYSFGILIVHVVSGKCPDDADRRKECCREDIAESVEKIGKPLKFLAKWCLDEEKKDRPHMEEIVQTLVRRLSCTEDAHQHPLGPVWKLEAKEKEIQGLKERLVEVKANGGNHLASIATIDSESTHKETLASSKENSKTSTNSFPVLDSHASEDTSKSQHAASPKALHNGSPSPSSPIAANPRGVQTLPRTGTKGRSSSRPQSINDAASVYQPALTRHNTGGLTRRPTYVHQNNSKRDSTKKDSASGAGSELAAKLAERREKNNFV